MDDLSIDIRAVTPEISGAPEARAFLVFNGQSLIDLIARLAVPGDKTASYAGIPPHVAFLPSRHLLGAPAPGFFFDLIKKPVLLDCICGEPLCWPVVATIEIRDNEVVLSEFDNPHLSKFNGLPSAYAHLGQFRFARDEYEAALAGPTL